MLSLRSAWKLCSILVEQRSVGSTATPVYRHFLQLLIALVRTSEDVLNFTHNLHVSTHLLKCDAIPSL